MKAVKLNIFSATFQVLLLSQFLCYTPVSFAQETLEYNGKYTLSGQLEGRVAYTYFLENGAKQKEGPFLFALMIEDSIQEDYIEKYQLKGQYKNNFKTDEWSFSHSSLSPENDEYIEGLYVKQTASGRIFNIKSQFKEGEANGKWTATSADIENSIVSDTTYFSSAEFKEGKFVNSIQVQNKTHQLVGGIDENSFLDGEWIIFHNDSSKSIIEYREYEAGILLSHVIEIDGKKQSLVYEGLGDLKIDDSLLTTIPINDTYFQLLKFGNFSVQNQEVISEQKIKALQNASQNLISKAFESLVSHNGYHIWDSKNQFELPNVKVKKYPFTKKEQNAINESLTIIEETEGLFNDFLNLAQVEISKNANDTIAKYYEIYTHYEKAFSEIQTTFEELRKPAFEFLNRSVIIPKIFSGTSFPDKITYEVNNKNYETTYDFPNDLKSDEAAIKSIYSQLSDINKELLALDSIVQPILKKEKQRADLAEDENKLVEKRDSIIQKFNDNDNLNEYQKQVSKEVISFVDNKFKKYAQQSLDKRIETLSSFLVCFDQLLDLYDQLEAMPKQIAEIKELYTRTVWNPFTMTDMDEIVKERVFTAYQNYILVYLMDELKKQIDCSNIENKMTNLNKLFQKMKELRQQDTSELEREIRREYDPEKLIKAFKLNLSTK